MKEFGLETDNQSDATVLLVNISDLLYFSVPGSMTVLSDEALILCKTMTLLVLLEGKWSVILHNFYSVRVKSIKSTRQI